MEETAPVVGTVLGSTYRLERLLGEGGMGSVYEASHLRVPRRFAVKLLNRDIVGNRQLFERFQREAEIASALGSEHITQVFDFNYADDGTPYMVLELLEGEDLSQRLARGRLSLADTIGVVEQTSEALEVAHQSGIVHRDLKPSNIYVCDRGARGAQIKILDFGISKVLHSDSGATRTGVILGTPNYMAPEQAEGRASEIDARTDLFAFGTIIYECLTGRVAFRAPTAVGTIYQVCHEEPEPLRELAPDLPRTLEAVIGRALAKCPDQRYATARELRDDFLRACSVVGEETVVLAGSRTAIAAPVAAFPTTLSTAASEATPRPIRTGSSWLRWAVGGTVLAAAVAGAMLILWARGGSGGRQSPERSEVALGAPVASAADAGIAPSPDVELPPAAAVVAPDAAPGPETVTITLEIEPEDAKVKVDGVVMKGPTVELLRSHRASTFVVSAAGFETQTREVSPLQDSVLEVALVKTRSRSRHRRHVSKRSSGGNPDKSGEIDIGEKIEEDW